MSNPLHKDEIIVPSSEYFPEIPGARVLVQYEGGHFPYPVRRVLARVIRPGWSKTGRHPSGLSKRPDFIPVESVESVLLDPDRESRLPVWPSLDILLVEPGEPLEFAGEGFRVTTGEKVPVYFMPYEDL